MDRAGLFLSRESKCNVDTVFLINYTSMCMCFERQWSELLNAHTNWKIFVSLMERNVLEIFILKTCVKNRMFTFLLWLKKANYTKYFQNFGFKWLSIYASICRINVINVVPINFFLNTLKKDFIFQYKKQHFCKIKRLKIRKIVLAWLSNKQ